MVEGQGLLVILGDTESAIIMIGEGEQCFGIAGLCRGAESDQVRVVVRAAAATGILRVGGCEAGQDESGGARKLAKVHRSATPKLRHEAGAKLVSLCIS